MRVGILGSEALDFKPNDIYRYVKNVITPHGVDLLITTEGLGVASTARDIAREHGIDLFIYNDYKSVVDNSDTVVVFRKDKEYFGYARYCAYKGRPFREYIVNTGC